MIGLGTIVNSLSIVVGGVLGIFFGRFLKERYQETVITVLGISTMIMALGSCLSSMLIVTTSKVNGSLVSSVETRGINIVWPGKIRVANILPAIVIAVIAGNLGY